ncbi:aspartic proteinase-like protein 2 [Gossypium australe]|uniref:Aspartic proteinase-like protein 2 n=1 Tax=Gossypium australe TaxID=47621 RepID=A0A5B6VY01_9ROSI|nr:aspartic proteinase-like protein 2 [Gossypium australe]
MAWPLVNLTVTFFFLIFLLSQSCLSISLPLLLPPPHPRARPAMVLPLFPSPKNTSTTFPDSSHRLLRSDSNSSHPYARMRLYDNLLSRGYYSTRLWIGTPPQRFALIVDTGSTVTYVPCAMCEKCGTHQDPKFQPELSSTYQPVKCNLDCNCDKDRDQCIYERQYAEMSVTSGILAEDVISFGNLSELSPQRIVFGCETEETGELYRQHADGIIGLGRGDLSIVDQLVEKGVISDSFSLCYGGMDVGGGAMVLGGISAPSDMIFSYSDPVRSPYYNIDLKEMHVAGKKLDLDPSVFDRKFGTVLDSGTTFAYFPEAVFEAFKDTIMKELNSLKQISGAVPSYNDTCFSGISSDVSQLSKTFPTIELVFENQQKLLLTPENYLFRVSFSKWVFLLSYILFMKHSKVQGAYCLGIFQNGMDPTTLLGVLEFDGTGTIFLGKALVRLLFVVFFGVVIGIIVRNTLVTYDRKDSKIGFWKTNCSELWERLHVTSAPSPSPSPSPSPFPSPSPSPSSSSGKENSTFEMPPIPAPEESPIYALIGEIEIGEISLDLALNVNHSYLKPRLVMLLEFMAKELGVNGSQVHLLNFTSEGNISFIKWSIVPSGSATYISNTTAINIISRLAEHRVMLPDDFGNYQLVQWEVKPPSKQTWWQRQYLVVLLGIMMFIIAGLIASGIWLWSRRRQAQVPYQPVDGAAREHELQPLQS